MRPVRAWSERSELRMSWFPTDSQAAGTLTITYLFFFYLLKGGPFHRRFYPKGGECFTWGVGSVSPWKTFRVHKASAPGGECFTVQKYA
jgi:hypothetical protein